MLFKKFFVNILPIAIITTFGANSSFAALTQLETPWSVGANLGMMQYNNMYKSDGQNALGRLSIEKQLYHNNYFGIGLEMGLQNGGLMRLNIPTETFEQIDGVPVGVQMKPTLDLLLTSEVFLLERTPLYALFKAGVAYRRMEPLISTTFESLSRISPEVQAGIGYPISKNASLNLTFQQIYGGPHDFNANILTGATSVSNIPTQQSVLIGFSIVL